MTETVHVWPREWQRWKEGGLRLLFVNLGSQMLFESLRIPGAEGGAYFVGQLAWPPKESPYWRAMSGFIARGGGSRGLFRLFDGARPRPRFDAGVTPQQTAFSDGSRFSDGSGWTEGYLPPFVAVHEGARAGDDSLVLRFPAHLASTPNILQEGDRIEIRPGGVWVPHAHYYEVTYDAGTNASGLVRVQFAPRLRLSVASGDQCVLREATTVMRLANDQEGDFVINAALHARLALSLIEHLPQG